MIGRHRKSGPVFFDYPNRFIPPETYKKLIVILGPPLLQPLLAPSDCANNLPCNRTPFRIRINEMSVEDWTRPGRPQSEAAFRQPRKVKSLARSLS